MTGYVPPTYKFFTFHIHIRTYFTTTSNSTKYKKPKYRIFTSKFTTLWTTSSTNTSDTPSQNTPPQPFVQSQPQPHTPTQRHHQNPITHKTYNIHLLRLMLTGLPSLPFQMKKHSMYPSQQMVVK